MSCPHAFQRGQLVQLGNHFGIVVWANPHPIGAHRVQFTNATSTQKWLFGRGMVRGGDPERWLVICRDE
jgi:hypothetical protein